MVCLSLEGENLQMVTLRVRFILLRIRYLFISNYSDLRFLLLNEPTSSDDSHRSFKILWYKPYEVIFLSNTLPQELNRGKIFGFFTSAQNNFD